MGTKSEHVISATAHNPGSAESIDLAVIDASVTLDETWSPFAQGQLTCWVPDAETLALLDPRLDTRLTLVLSQAFGISQTFADFDAVWAGATFADFDVEWAGKTFDDFDRAHSKAWNAFGFRGPETITLDLSMRSRLVDYEAGTVTFELASDEALLQDYALASLTSEGPGGTSVIGAVTLALGKIGATLLDYLPGEAEPESLIWEPGTTAWDYLSPVLQAANLRLYCDESRQWHLANPVFAAPGSLRLSGEQGVTSAQQTVSRDSDWFDAVVIKYAWTDEFDLAVTAFDIAAPEGYSKVYTLEYNTPYPGAGAAQGVLNRAAGRGRVFAVESISAYEAYPGMSLVLSLPHTPIQTGVVSAVTWGFPDDRMRVTSRGLVDTPATSWLLAPEGYAWSDSPVGTSWAEYLPV